MPVGHEETPTMTVPSADRSGACASAAGSAALPASAGSGSTCSVTMRATSSGVVALRRASVNSGSIRPRASLARSWRWKSSAPAGAAIMKTRSAACSSAAPKSTASARRAKPREGASTCGLRQCGMAMPPGMPVGAVASRARASPARPSVVSARPAEATTWARNSMTSFLVEPGRASSRTSSGVIRGVDASEGAALGGMLLPRCPMDAGAGWRVSGSWVGARAQEPGRRLVRGWALRRAG